MAGFAAIYNTPKKKVQLKLLTSAYTTNETEAFDELNRLMAEDDVFKL